MDSKFLDRHRAGQVLAQELFSLRSAEQGMVLALPRGGVPIGYEIARTLNWPLDVWLVRKLGVPDQPELAMGAIALPNAQVLNTGLIEKLNISESQIEAVLYIEKQELERRNQCYRQGQPQPNIKGKTIILVDDGLATGATMQAAISSLKQYHPASITVAVPIAAPNSLKFVEPQVDHIVCPIAPACMGSISQWYVHFDPVADEEVVTLLQKAELDKAHSHESTA
ncbi:MAG: phosphoribosyltransferase [Leptolyngbya sp. SIO1D8]|nr:phosphoribosyltransferase [Leptolyngbya sp. SIO1D8]